MILKMGVMFGFLILAYFYAIGRLEFIAKFPFIRFHRPQSVVEILDVILKERIAKKNFIADSLYIHRESQTLIMIWGIIEARPILLSQIVGYLKYQKDKIKPEKQLEDILDFVKEVRFHKYKQAPINSEFFNMETYDDFKNSSFGGQTEIADHK